jgi:hypothetical protein
LHGLAPVFGLADDFDVGLGRQQGTQALANDGVIVG